ncbi:DNA-methyltransferase [Corynebacterium neomassiliense]|uniref:DNA-methyltransferase n=1 Tax=Corynebacterium neomassiliense TaxID=2079482 RepID=UPI00192A41B9|nr:DNA methyltransferase [Corynebacterium neomassiliense]
MSDQITLAFPIPKPAPTGSVDLRHGDCLTVLRDLPDNSVDSVVTDPPYGLSNTKPAQVADVLAAWVTGDTEAVPAKRGGFMGKDWDSFVPPPAVWAECLRVLKPGGHMAVFAGARTQDLMGLSIRLAGFEIRDTLGWVYGSGFPKSMDVPKAIESTLTTGKSNSRSLRKTEQDGDGEAYTLTGKNNGIMGETRTYERKQFAPATDAARQWDGWGTALKPAIEPIILARKPLDGTVAANVLAHGVGGLNIDACRVGGDSGRFPANVLLDEHAAKEMDEQSGWSKSPDIGSVTRTKPRHSGSMAGAFKHPEAMSNGHGDAGGASRFFPVFKYQAKAPKKERPVIVREDGTKIAHPTVKPLALMEWLVTLITPEGGTTLDPFAGTGTTLQAARDNGFDAIGVEQDPDYLALIGERLGRHSVTEGLPLWEEVPA